MKEIIRQYGGAVITSLVAIALLGLIMAFPFPGGNGVPQALGSWLMGESKNCLAAIQEECRYSDYESVNDVQITFFADTSLSAGKWSEVGDYFGAGSQEDGQWNLHIYRITDESGNPCPTKKINGKEYLYPEQPGIYQVYLGARKEGKKEIKAFLSFPVQKMK